MAARERFGGEPLLVTGVVRAAMEAARDDPRIRRLYLRNLSTWAPPPFFNTGLVVDTDRTNHPSNIGLSGALDDTRARPVRGTRDDPSEVALAAKSREVTPLLEAVISPRAWSTQAVDAQLSVLCRDLCSGHLANRRRRRARTLAARR